MAQIRFIDTQYNTLFKVENGGKIKITDSQGNETIKRVIYLDDYHFKFEDGSTFDMDITFGRTVIHICQWAEFCEAEGFDCEPI